MFFTDWFGLLRIAVVGTLAYFGLILLLRVSGKRTLSKMNAFDFIVTIALGSTLATVLLSRDVPLLEGIFAFALLIFWQLVLTWLATRSARVEALLKSQPTLLFFRGQFLDDALQKQRLTRDEVRAAIRTQNLAQIENALAVVLETDGSLSVLKTSEQNNEFSALQNVRGTNSG